MSTSYGATSRRTPVRTSRPRRPDIALCYGTRPQVIKVAPLLRTLRDRWRVLTVDTGQHYDFALNAQLYQDLGMPSADVFLGAGPSHPVEQTAHMAAACAHVLMQRRPRAVVVIGDTNSTLACAIAAHHLSIPLVHVEAGLRSDHPEMAEERNRRAVDHMSALLCAPSASAVATLHAERVTGEIVLSGDIARDALGLVSSHVVRRSGEGAPYIFATLHRAELTSHADALTAVVRALGTLGRRVVLPLHPRTRGALEALGLLTTLAPSIEVHAPLGYLETVSAIREADCVVTDSGGVQREAYWLGTPCVTLRTETEWGETLTCGANRLVAPAEVVSRLGNAVHEAAVSSRHWARDAYGAGDAAARIADAVGSLLPARRSRVAAVAT